MIWKQIPGFQNSQVSNTGLIRSYGKERKLQVTKGYKTVILTESKTQKKFTVHRLVAMTFLPNPTNLPQVNHKDGDKFNNRVENLEWCTNQQNQQHRREILGKKNDRKILCLETGIVYNSLKEAAMKINSHIPNLVRACKTGSRANGFHWQYGG